LFAAFQDAGKRLELVDLGQVGLPADYTASRGVDQSGV